MPKDGIWEYEFIVNYACPYGKMVILLISLVQGYT